MKEVVKNKVYDKRLEADMRQEDLAQLVGVSRQTIIAIEKGNYTPSVALAMKLASVFKSKVEDVFSIDYEK